MLHHYKSLLLFTLFLPISSYSEAQNTNTRGQFSPGIRTTLNTFSQGQFENIGWGIGGHFNLWLSDNVSTLWFVDYIHTDIEHIANREDYHIGWSVMYYPFKSKPKIKSFIQAGHCFDYSKVAENGLTGGELDSWSSAIQAGGGADFILSSKVYLAISGQYMIHLGEDVHAHVESNQVILKKKSGVNLESHMLLTLSINYKLFDLWN